MASVYPRVAWHLSCGIKGPSAHGLGMTVSLLAV
jgi:hypothetical protein